LRLVKPDATKAHHYIWVQRTLGIPQAPSHLEQRKFVSGVMRFRVRSA